MSEPRTVRAHWDPEAKVWWAESDEVPGLVAEAATLDQLTAEIMAAIADVFHLNEPGTAELPVRLVADLPARAHHAA